MDLSDIFGSKEISELFDGAGKAAKGAAKGVAKTVESTAKGAAKSVEGAARGAAGKPHHCVNAPEMPRFVLRCPGAHYDIVKSAKCN